TVPGFSILSANDSLFLCPGGSASYQILTSAQQGFNNDVSFLALGLPAGVTAVFSPDTVTPGSPVTLTLSQSGALPLATYAFNLVAVPSAGGSPQVQALVFTTLDGLPSAPQLSSPAAGTIGVSRAVQLSWAPVAGAFSYTVQISGSPAFTTLVSQVNNITGNSYTADPQLASYTTYYWRVQAVNLCGPGNYSAASAFQTGVCQSLTNAQVPVTIPLFGNPATVTSTLGVSVNGAISDVNVLNIAGVHTSVSDLTFTLISPAGTEVTLVANPCTAADENFDFNFDDESTQTTLPCPPTAGGVYQPLDSLSAFDGQNAFGVWTLRIRDNVNFDGGTLNSWNLEVCVDGYPNPILITNDTLNVPRGSARFITDTLLKVNDQISNPFNITYTLVSLPEHGELKKNGTTLAIGQTFSQNDITTGLLQYDHDASYTVADSFRFTVNNQVGGWLGIPVFHIKVGFATDVENDLPGLSLEVFPNPADQEIALRVAGALNGAVSAELTDLRGRILRSYQGTARAGFETRWNVSDLPAGIYMLQFRSEEGMMTHKVIIR
ncbi:MAG: T9SS C-terminal target domain-containing protein, partial [Bacteroidetes bacterium]